MTAYLLGGKCVILMHNKYFIVYKYSEIVGLHKQHTSCTCSFDVLRSLDSFSLPIMIPVQHPNNLIYVIKTLYNFCLSEFPVVPLYYMKYTSFVNSKFNFLVLITLIFIHFVS